MHIYKKQYIYIQYIWKMPHGEYFNDLTNQLLNQSLETIHWPFKMIHKNEMQHTTLISHSDAKY